MGGEAYDVGRNDKHFQRKTTMTVTRKSILALVVSSSGSIQDGLLALMTTIPSISAVLVAEDVNSTLRMIEYHQPALIILDMSLLKVQDVIKEIKTHWPHIRLITLAEDILQQEEAKASGSDSVLIMGFPAQKLVDIIENSIDCRADTPLVSANGEGGAHID
ncbi:MAG: response regulator transcription factor [Chloroflexi bacterium]|nr:response regulator transcription factor [Chloroflexota bacterium]